jgi:hypothetical protein
MPASQRFSGTRLVTRLSLGSFRFSQEQTVCDTLSQRRKPAARRSMSSQTWLEPRLVCMGSGRWLRDRENRDDSRPRAFRFNTQISTKPGDTLPHLLKTEA